MSEKKQGFKITIEAEEGSLDGLVASFGSLLERIEVSRQNFATKMESERQKFDIVMSEKDAMERQEKQAQIAGLVDTAKTILTSGLMSSFLPSGSMKAVQLSTPSTWPSPPPSTGSDQSISDILTEFVAQHSAFPGDPMGLSVPPLDKSHVLRFLMRRGVFNRGTELRDFVASVGGMKNALLGAGATDEFAGQISDMLEGDFEDVLNES